MMMKIEESKELVVEGITKELDIDKSIVDCWFENYQSPQCSMLVGSCKRLCQCQELDSIYKNKRRQNDGI